MDDHTDETFEQFEPFDSNDKKSPHQLSAPELYKRITHRAITYLSRREYSQAELARKLKFAFQEYEFPTNEQWENLEAVIEAVLARLTKENWQSDERYAQQISKVKGERHGAARVKQTLTQQGLDRELIDAKVHELKQSEPQRAQAVWAKKFGTQPTNAQEYARQARFLANRGFAFDVIKKVLKGRVEELDE